MSVQTKFYLSTASITDKKFFTKKKWIRKRVLFSVWFAPLCFLYEFVQFHFQWAYRQVTINTYHIISIVGIIFFYYHYITKLQWQQINKTHSLYSVDCSQQITMCQAQGAQHRVATMAHKALKGRQSILWLIMLPMSCSVVACVVSYG